MGGRSWERRSTRGVRRRLLSALLFGLLLLLVPGMASSAEGPTVEAVGGVYGYSWSPASAQTATGGAVNFKSSSASVEHGITWSGGPTTPACSGVPINEGKTSWSGSCTFPQAGSYAYYCTVHPIEMKGTVTTSTSGSPDPTPTPTPNPPPPGSDGSLIQGSASRALKLAKSQQGNVVRGSVALSEAAAGGRLEVSLYMAAGPRSGSGRVTALVRVGRLARGGLTAGRFKFSVPLRRAARLALRDRGRLPLKVGLTITSNGRALILNRSVAVHD